MAVNVAEQARVFVSNLDQNSRLASAEDRTGQIALFYMFAPKGPDDGPDPDLAEVTPHLQLSEWAAADIARNLCLHGYELFGYDAPGAQFVHPEDRGFRTFFRLVGSVTLGHLYPDQTDPKVTVDSYGEALYNLRQIRTAIEDFTKSRGTG